MLRAVPVVPSKFFGFCQRSCGYLTITGRFYMSCYQLNVGGSGSGSPATVSLPGAYKASDPGVSLSVE